MTRYAETGRVPPLRNCRGHQRIEIRIAQRTARRPGLTRRLDEVPEYARAAIKKLVDRGIPQGVGPDDLGLTQDLIRMLTINDRAGVYD